MKKLLMCAAAIAVIGLYNAPVDAAPCNSARGAYRYDRCRDYYDSERNDRYDGRYDDGCGDYCPAPYRGCR